MISGCSSSRDRAHALEQDVDDYLIKPAEPREMAARLRAVVRRLKPIGTVTWGPFRIDLVRNQVWVDRTEISALEPAHIRLLAYLAIRAGRICTYVELHEAIFKTAWRPDNRNCARAISALRACCGEAGKLIATVRGEGYALGIEGARQLPVTACDR
jgi:DNA-binding response OmpR family regulator